MLITERVGRLRIVRNGVLDPTPVAGAPAVLSRATMAGLMDIALHPRFAENKWIFISYHKPVADGIASNAILRGTWDGKALTDVRDIFVADDVDMEASRIVFGRDGTLFMGIGGPGTGPAVSAQRHKGRQELRLARDQLRPRLPRSAPDRVARRRDVADGAATAARLQRQLGGAAAGNALERSAPAHPRRATGTDGLLYVLTEEDKGALLRIEPAN